MNKEPKSVEITLDKNAGISSSPAPTMRDRLTNVENLTKAILWVGIISVVGVIVTCSALVIDQMHFNSQTYRDNSQVNELKYQELTKKIEVLEAQISSVKRPVEYKQPPPVRK